LPDAGVESGRGDIFELQKKRLNPLKSHPGAQNRTGRIWGGPNRRSSAAKGAHEMIVYCDARLNEKIIHAVGVVF
jgi:hypothetical protein